MARAYSMAKRSRGNPQRRKDLQRGWHEAHPNYHREYNKTYRERDREKRSAYGRARRKRDSARAAVDPVFKRERNKKEKERYWRIAHKRIAQNNRKLVREWQKKLHTTKEKASWHVVARLRIHAARLKARADDTDLSAHRKALWLLAKASALVKTLRTT